MKTPTAGDATALSDDIAKRRRAMSLAATAAGGLGTTNAPSVTALGG